MRPCARRFSLSRPSRDGGRFDKQTYERVLSLQGLTPSAYEEQLRRGLLSTQLARAVTGSAFATEAEVDAAARLLRQRRDIAYVVLPRRSSCPTRRPRTRHPGLLRCRIRSASRSPERVKISYLLLDAARLSADTGPTDEEPCARPMSRASTSSWSRSAARSATSCCRSRPMRTPPRRSRSRSALDLREQIESGDGLRGRREASTPRTRSARPRVAISVWCPRHHGPGLRAGRVRAGAGGR
jgi:hypothetical protein